MEPAAVRSFRDATGASDAQATALLNAFGGDVDAAVNAFFEDGGAMDDEHVTAETHAPAAAPQPAFQSSAGGGSGRAAPTQARGKAPAARAGNVRSLADLAGGGDGDDSDDEGPVETFIGGAKSGQMVQDPKQDRVGNLFDRAQKAGATHGRPEDLQPQSGDSRAKAFSGQGRTLSGAPAALPPPAAPAPPAPVVHTITFYTNGFTVNGGPLRRTDDPANAPFMEAIANGLYPDELRPEHPDAPVHVNLVRKDEAWTAPPEPKYTAFSGAGRTLGGGAGPSGAGASGSAPPPDAATAAPVGAWSVDESAPTTSIQLRLADGSRVVARFNVTHTVAHIRAFIDTVRPGTGALGALQLAGMPPRVLADGSATLEAAGLLNAVVIQKA